MNNEKEDEEEGEEEEGRRLWKRWWMTCLQWGTRGWTEGEVEKLADEDDNVVEVEVDDEDEEEAEEEEEDDDDDEEGWVVEADEEGLMALAFSRAALRLLASVIRRLTVRAGRVGSSDRGSKYFCA